MRSHNKYMPKTHASLSPKINVLLIFIWALVATALFFFIKPQIPFTLAISGGVLGVLCGLMQQLSFEQAKSGFVKASSLMDVHRAFTSTKWGRRYIYWLYFCNFILIALAFILIGSPFFQVLLGYFAAYTSLMFVREVVTLRDTITLHCLFTSGSINE
jgi:hypothetical protein